MQMEQNNLVKNKLLRGLAYTFFLTGALVLMTSSLLVYIMPAYGLTYDQGGFLLTIQAVASISTNFLSGPLSLWLGRKNTLLLAAAAFFLGLVLIALLPPLAILQLALFITGLAWGISNNMVNYLTLEVTSGSSKEITKIHASFSVGAFLAPLLVALTVRLGLSWRWPVILIAGFAVYLFIYLVRLDFPENKKMPAQHKPSAKSSVFSSWRLYLYMLILFCYVGVETGFSGWLVSYLTSWRGLDAALAQSLLSAMWVAIIVGRLTMSAIGASLRKKQVILIEAALILLAAFLLATASSALFLSIAVILLGLAMSAFYGMTLASAGELVTKSAVASGLLMSFGGLGASLLPLLAGVFAQRSGILSGIQVLLATAALLTGLTLVNLLIPDRSADLSAKKNQFDKSALR